MANTVDVVLLRNRRKRRRRIIKVVVFLLFAALCIFIYSKREIWFSQLEGIGSRYQTVTHNEEAEAEGVFELTISGGVQYHADFINSNMFILYDKYLYIYGTDGKEKDRRQHAYSNAVMKVAGERSLIYSSNGTSFRVDTPSKLVYEIVNTDPIWFAVLSEEGYVAVVSDSDTYACRLTIYDTAGKVVYTRECVERLSDVSFHGNGCIFSTISAADGELMTTLQYITFDSDEARWETEPLDTLCLNVYALADGGAFVIGDTKSAYYSSTGALVGTYDHNGVLLDHAFKDGRGAVLLKNEERRQSILMLFSDKSSAPAYVYFDSIMKNVIVDNETAYVLGGGHIDSYAFSGDQVGTVEVTDAYDRILRYGKSFYLLGYDKIHRTESN